MSAFIFCKQKLTNKVITNIYLHCARSSMPALFCASFHGDSGSIQYFMEREKPFGVCRNDSYLRNSGSIPTILYKTL